MAILHHDQLNELLANNDLIIQTTESRIPFDIKSQISSDTIDLRLYPKALVYKNGLEIVDTLAPKYTELFEEVHLSTDGYILESGQVIFGSTLEIICIKNGKYTGRLSNRGTFSRFGISVTCGKMRFPSGDPGTPDLQIVNHSSVPVKIYPFSFIVQLQIETMEGTPEPYDGVYPKSIGPVPPQLSERDREVKKLLATFDLDSNLAKNSHDSSEKILESIASLSDNKKKSWFFYMSLSKKLRASLSVFLTMIIAALMAFVVNLMTQEEWGQWKIYTVIFSGVLLIILMLMLILISYISESD